MTFKDILQGDSNSLYDYDISFPKKQNTEKGHLGRQQRGSRKFK